MTDTVSILVAIIGCFVGLAGWLAGRDKKISNDGEWRGTVNTKLDAIHNDIGGVGTEIRSIKETLSDHGDRIIKVEESTKQAHKRINEIVKGGS